MENKPPIFCGLAFGSVSINGLGQYQPCCGIVSWPIDQPTITGTVEEKINSPRLVDLRKKLMNGEWPTSCNKCKLSEELNGQSMRVGWNLRITEDSVPMAERLDLRNIQYLDISLGSKCNSKCMTCSWHSSTLWEDEFAFIFGYFEKNPRISISREEIKELTESFPNLKGIMFVGGEPTVMSEHIEFLKELVNLGKSQNIDLSYVTNLTGITEELITLWGKFNHVHVAVSIDGYKKTNDYIRYPISWDKVEKNLRRYFSLVQNNPVKHTIALSTTLSVFNVHSLCDLFSFWKDLTQEYKINSWIHTQAALRPQHVNGVLLPKEYRQPEIARLKNMISSWEGQTNLPQFSSFDTIIEWLDSNYVKSSDHYGRMKVLIERSDLYRNRNIRDFIPELADCIFKNE